MTDTWDDDDRAIAHALGTHVPADGAAIDDAAVADYEAVLARLPVDEVDPPPDLEDRVVAAALARRPAAARAIDGKRPVEKRAPAREARRWIGAAAAAVAAAAIIVVLLASRTPSVPGPPAGQIEPTAATADVAQVLAQPGTRQGVLRSPAGTAGGRVVLGADGSGYLTDLTRDPDDTATYWLWLDTGAAPVRVGSIPKTATVHFGVRGDVDAVRGVIISPAPTAPDPFSLRASLST